MLRLQVIQLGEQCNQAEKKAQHAAQTLAKRQQELEATEHAITAARQCLEDLQHEGQSVAAAKLGHGEVLEGATQSEALADRVQVSTALQPCLQFP